MNEKQKPTRELTIGEIITQTFSIYSQKFTQYLIPFLAAGIITGLITMAIYYTIKIPTPPLSPPQNPTPEEIANWLSQFSSYLAAVLASALLAGIIGWIINQITQGIGVKFTADTLEKGKADLRTSFNFTISKLLSLLAVSIITGILIILGVIAFIIPGIILAIIFSLVVPTIIIENTGTLESLSRSRLLVSHRWLKTFALLLILYLIIGIANILIGAIVFPFREAAPLASGILAAFIQPILPIGLTLYYYSMIARATPQETPQTTQTP
ncbi:MAG: hypothetical protein ACQXXH_07590 [Candidatus Bathyarchaeia archaeon]|jgi:hypothetical protein|nr:hypothetical protein [Candidatus Bathyarchaeota archaeon A05DMB-4]MDH7595874.1 hypothetical protein [Candidatus Bathyarchaeota archaeon]